MVNIPATASLRGYAKHRGQSAAWIHKLCVDGVLTRDASGRIDIAAADRILDERNQVRDLGRLAGNQRQRERLREAAHEALAVPMPDVEPADDLDGEGLIDFVMADACLDAQPGWEIEREARTPVEKMLERFDAAFGAAQAKIVGAAIDQTCAAIGSAGNSEAVRRIMGHLFGALRQLITDQRLILEREVTDLLTREGEP